jgi:hypothetical protein
LLTATSAAVRILPIRLSVSSMQTARRPGTVAWRNVCSVPDRPLCPGR